MADILRLSRRNSGTPRDFIQHNEMLEGILRAKILKSFQLIECEAVPLLNEIRFLIQREARDAALLGKLPKGALESAKSAEHLAAQIQSLVQCYQEIFLSDSCNSEKLE